MAIKTLKKVWYNMGEYGGFAGMIYSIMARGDPGTFVNYEIFAISAIACLYGAQGLSNMKTDERISKLEAKLKE